MAETPQSGKCWPQLLPMETGGDASPASVLQARRWMSSRAAVLWTCLSATQFPKQESRSVKFSNTAQWLLVVCSLGKDGGPVWRHREGLKSFPNPSKATPSWRFPWVILLILFSLPYSWKTTSIWLAFWAAVTASVESAEHSILWRPHSDWRSPKVQRACCARPSTQNSGGCGPRMVSLSPRQILSPKTKQTDRHTHIYTETHTQTLAHTQTCTHTERDTHRHNFVTRHRL